MSGNPPSVVFNHHGVPRLIHGRARVKGTTATKRAARADVVLISMPFGPLRHPSLGLSLLKPTLEGVDCEILYFTLPFSDLIGSEFYEWLASYPYGTSLLGEWLFSASVFDQSPRRIEDYLNTVLRQEADPGLFSKRVVRDLITIRGMIDGFLDECSTEILSRSPRIVGLTSVFQQQMASLGLAKMLKAASPDLFVVFGGANCEGVMGREIIRQFEFVDAVVSGEGDLVFGALVEGVLSGRGAGDVAGVLSRNGSWVDAGAAPGNAASVMSMDSLPYPDFSDFFAQWEESAAAERSTPRLLFETSRGCWWGAKHHCTFCGLNGASMSFRSKSAGRALDELEHLTRTYPGCSVLSVDNILDTGYFRDFIPGLAERGLNLKMFFEVKSNLSREQVRMLRDAGITEIQPGIESLSDSVLGLMRKGVTGLQNIQLLKWCAELGVWPTWHFLWGFPGEEPEEYARMADWIPLLSHLPPPRIGTPIRLDRFSPNYDRAEELGFANLTPFEAYRYIYPLEPAAVSNLAYYFTYDYREPQDVSAYTKELKSRIKQWQQSYAESELFQLDVGGELWIWDFRPVAVEPLTIMSGLDRALYLACDRARSLHWLAANSETLTGGRLSPAMIEEALGPAVDRGLMIRDRDHVLSLAMAKSEAGQNGQQPKKLRARARSSLLPA